MEQQRIEVVGKLGSTYGIRGWLRILFINRTS